MQPTGSAESTTTATSATGGLTSDLKLTAASQKISTVPPTNTPGDLYSVTRTRSPMMMLSRTTTGPSGSVPGGPTPTSSGTPAPATNDALPPLERLLLYGSAGAIGLLLLAVCLLMVVTACLAVKLKKKKPRYYFTSTAPGNVLLHENFPDAAVSGGPLEELELPTNPQAEQLQRPNPMTTNCSSANKAESQHRAQYHHQQQALEATAHRSKSPPAISEGTTLVTSLINPTHDQIDLTPNTAYETTAAVEHKQERAANTTATEDVILVPSKHKYVPHSQGNQLHYGCTTIVNEHIQESGASKDVENSGPYAKVRKKPVKISINFKGKERKERKNDEDEEDPYYLVGEPEALSEADSDDPYTLVGRAESEVSEDSYCLVGKAGSLSDCSTNESIKCLAEKKDDRSQCDASERKHGGPGTNPFEPVPGLAANRFSLEGLCSMASNPNLFDRGPSNLDNTTLSEHRVDKYRRGYGAIGTNEQNHLFGKQIALKFQDGKIDTDSSGDSIDGIMQTKQRL